MNLRTKIAALTLAAGTVVAGGAALTCGTAAQAAPNPTDRITIDSDPPISITPPPSLVTIPPHITLPPRVTIPTVPHRTVPTTPDPTTPGTDPRPCTDCDPDWTGSTAVAPVDAPVKGSPAFTG